MSEVNSTAPNPPAEERPHKAADDKEEVYFEGSPMLRGEVGKVLLYMLVAIGLIALGVALWNKTPWWVTVGLIVVALGVLAWPKVMARRIRYRISNYRIDYERGLLSKKIDTLELWHVEDIQFRQGPLDQLLNVGNITVISRDDTNPQLQLWGLPNPRPLFELLKQRIIAVKRQRGVIKMDVG